MATSSVTTVAHVHERAPHTVYRVLKYLLDNDELLAGEASSSAFDRPVVGAFELALTFVSSSNTIAEWYIEYLRGRCVPKSSQAPSWAGTAPHLVPRLLWYVHMWASLTSSKRPPSPLTCILCSLHESLLRKCGYHQHAAWLWASTIELLVLAGHVEDALKTLEAALRLPLFNGIATLKQTQSNALLSTVRSLAALLIPVQCHC